MGTSDFTNRLGIFIYYDELPGIENYVIYILKEIKTVVNELIIVVNGKIAEVDLQLLEKYTPNIYRRENRGFDGGAYQYVICEVLGQEKLCRYSQVVLVNNSFYGPFVPMVKIFGEMEMQKLDFWGINSYFCEGIRPFIESYFLVIEREMLHSLNFWNFWVELESDVEVITETIHNFEWRFTWYFEDIGYCWNVYTDKTDERRKGEALDIYKNPYSALQKIQLPVLKRKAFEWSEARKYIFNETARALDYIYYETNYNIDYVLHDIRKRYGRESNLNFDYVLDARGNMSGHEKDAAVIFIVHEENISYIEKKLSEGSIDFNCYFLIHNNVQLHLDAMNVYTFKSTNSCIELMDNISKKYKYICCVQDKIYRSDMSMFIPQMEIDYIFANLINNNTYMNKIIEILERKKYLKALFWRQGKSMFWIGSKLLCDVLVTVKTCQNWMNDIGECAATYTEKIGGLWGTVMCAESAAIEMNKQAYEVNCICRRFGFNSAEGLMAREYKLNEVIKFCELNDLVYVYGAGTYARHIVEELFFRGIAIKGIIVSDGKPKKDCLYIYPVYYLSEIEITSEVGVVIAVKLRKEIRKKLQEKGCKKMLAVT